MLLDFRQIHLIGPAFADEIFRVFANAHPNTKLIYINANEEVTMMIRRAQATRGEGQDLSSIPDLIPRHNGSKSLISGTPHAHLLT